MLFSRIHALSIKRMRNPRCDFVQELSPRSLCRTAHSFFRFHHRFTAVSRVFPPMRSFFRRKSMVARLLKTRSARCASLISPCTGWQHAFKSRMRAFYPAVKPDLVRILLSFACLRSAWVRTLLPCDLPVTSEKGGLSPPFIFPANSAES